MLLDGICFIMKSWIGGILIKTVGSSLNCEVNLSNRKYRECYAFFSGTQYKGYEECSDNFLGCFTSRHHPHGQSTDASYLKRSKY